MWRKLHVQLEVYFNVQKLLEPVVRTQLVPILGGEKKVIGPSC